MRKPLKKKVVQLPLAGPAERASVDSRGSLPEAGFNALIPELDVSDLAARLRFWCGLLGFNIAYDRPSAHFNYLNPGPVHIMLCERNGSREVGELTSPFERGVKLQMMVDPLSPILEALERAEWPLFRREQKVWHRARVMESGQREFLVQDPDGYLLRFAEDLGVCPAKRADCQEPAK